MKHLLIYFVIFVILTFKLSKSSLRSRRVKFPNVRSTKCRYSSEDNYYCRPEYQCFTSTAPNTACWRKPCGPTSTCGPNFKSLPFNDFEREFMLRLHNGYRQRIASGEEDRQSDLLNSTKLKPANNMKVLRYNKHLEFMAQCWSNFCMHDGWSRFHDECKRTPQFPSIGQNAFLYAHVSPYVERINFSKIAYLGKAVDSWYFEIYRYNTKTTPKYYWNSETSNFTQLIWANTSDVGCGRTQYGYGRVLRLLIFCNYAHGGNLVGRKVYKESRDETCCNNCDGRYVYYLTENDPKVLKESISSALTLKAQELRKRGCDTSKLYKMKSFRTVLMTGCSFEFPCLCGKTLSVNESNENYSPAFKISSSNHSIAKIYLYVMLQCCVYLSFTFNTL